MAWGLGGVGLRASGRRGCKGMPIKQLNKVFVRVVHLHGLQSTGPKPQSGGLEGLGLRV